MKKITALALALGLLTGGNAIATSKDYSSWEQLTPQQAYFARHF